MRWLVAMAIDRMIEKMTFPLSSISTSPAILGAAPMGACCSPSSSISSDERKKRRFLERDRGDTFLRLFFFFALRDGFFRRLASSGSTSFSLSLSLDLSLSLSLSLSPPSLSRAPPPSPSLSLPPSLAAPPREQ